jgi:hypothetical protein
MSTIVGHASPKARFALRVVPNPHTLQVTLQEPFECPRDIMPDQINDQSPDVKIEVPRVVVRAS